MAGEPCDGLWALGQGRRSPRRSPHLFCSGSTTDAAIVPAARARLTVVASPVHWLRLAGGPRPLWWSATVLTLGQLGRPGGDRPATRMTWRQAQQAARVAGGRLPTAGEWEAMAFDNHRRFPWGNGEWTPQRANLRGCGHDRVLPVGLFPAGDTPDGVRDVAGNTWEWTATTLPNGAAIVLGGSYNSLPRYGSRGYRNEVPIDLVSPGIGLRVVREA